MRLSIHSLLLNRYTATLHNTHTSHAFIFTQTQTQLKVDWIEIGKAFGFPSLIFAVWYIYHVSEVKKWEQREEADKEKWKLILTEVKDQHNQHFEMLRDALDHVGILASSVKELTVEFRTFKERALK